MSSDRVPDILLEQYLLGETNEQTVQRIEADPDSMRRVEALRADTAEFAAAHPADLFATRIRNQFEAERQELAPSRRRRWTVFLGIGLPTAAALAFAIIFAISVSPATPGSGTATEITRLKGAEPQMQIFRSAQGEPLRLDSGAVASAGDLLQITYNAAEARFGMICSLDGNGVVTLHFPVSEVATPELSGGGTQQLQYAYRLDNAPGFENFYFITSDTEFSVQSVLDMVRQESNRIVGNPAGELRLPSSLTVQSITIAKGE